MPSRLTVPRVLWRRPVIASTSSRIRADAAARPGFDDKEIRIAQWGPQTGPAAPWGSVARGSGLLFNVVNEQGGIHGRMIKYFIRDDQYNPSQTMAAVRDLVDRQGVFAFVGGVGTAPGLAVRDYLRQKKIIWTAVCTGAKGFYEPHNPYFWGMWVLYEDDGSIIAKFLVEKKKFKKITLFRIYRIIYHSFHLQLFILKMEMELAIII